MFPARKGFAYPNRGKKFCGPEKPSVFQQERRKRLVSRYPLSPSRPVLTGQALADRRTFRLDERRWRAFQDVLDRPVADKPRLARLLAEKSALE